MKKSRYLTLLAIVATVSCTEVTNPKLKDFPVDWDWRTRSSVIGAVKNQTDGKNPSWAFAVTSAIEAQYGLKYNNPGSFSA